jgi:hypothetical protein
VTIEVALLADALPETALTVLKFALLALIYLFLARIVRVVVLELRTPAGSVDGSAPAGGRAAPKAGKSVGSRLRVLEPAARRGSVYPLGDELTVGRGGGCGVVLVEDDFVSTVHARLFRRDKDLFVEDLGSRNGTYVNGEQIQSPTRLHRGDRVQFGQTVTEVTR